MDRQDIMTEGLIDLSEAPTLRARRDALGRLGRYAAAGLVLPPGLAALPALAADNEDDTYDEDSVLKAATDFFGETTEGLAKVIEKAFKDQGRPNAYIKGQEASGALTVGLRYGEGSLIMKRGGGSLLPCPGPSMITTRPSAESASI